MLVGMLLFRGPAARVMLGTLVRRDADLIAIGSGLLAACFAFSMLTLNHSANGIAYGFVSTAMLSVVLLRWLSDVDWTVLARAASVIIVALALFDAVRFDIEVNRTRRVHDMVITDSSEVLPAVTPALRFLRWAIPSRYTISPQDVADVIDFFRTRGNFFLVGDSSILYGLTKHPSVSPVVWFDPGLTLPLSTAPSYAQFLRRLYARMEQYDVKYLVVEGDATLQGVSLSQLGDVAQRRRCKEWTFGSYRIFELCGASAPVQ
jgi:hypothetical protein